MFSPKSILVPSDFSEYSDRALQKAVDLAREYKAKIYLLHVIDKGLQQCVEMYCLSNDVMVRMEREEQESTRKLLDQQIARVPGAREADISIDIRKGYPDQEIVKDQKENGRDLIVIASHGRTGILANLMGSTADKVLRNASSPVLLVRP